MRDPDRHFPAPTAVAAAAAQMAQQILANTNVTLKQELVKIPDFWGEKGKDTVTPTQFMARIDECQIANDWNDTTTYANFSLCLRGEADEWLASKVKVLLGAGNGFTDSVLDPSPSSCDLVDLNSSCKGLTGGVVNANCGGLYDDVPCAALARVAG